MKGGTGHKFLDLSVIQGQGQSLFLSRQFTWKQINCGDHHDGKPHVRKLPNS